MRTASRLSAAVAIVLTAACNTTRYKPQAGEQLKCSPPYLLDATNHTTWVVDVYERGAGKGTFLGSLQPGDNNQFQTSEPTGARWVRHDPSPLLGAPSGPTTAEQNRQGVTFRTSCA